MTELYKVYRPRKLSAVVGQSGPIATLQKFLDKGNMPHSLLFTGPSGTGKTTLARILKKALNCGDQDYIEINSADFKGIDMVRDVRRSINGSPIWGDCRIWLIDECHKLTNDAQNAFLKLLEDTPKHAYFFLCTTDPQKLIKTIHTRCSEIKLTPLAPKEVEEVLRHVIDAEEMTVTDDVITELVSVAEGSARKALVILEQVGHLGSEREQLEALRATTINKDVAISLARALINPSSKWQEVAAILKNIEDEPEGVRYLVLGYSRSVLLGGGKLSERAFKIIDIFSRNFYDSKQAGLAAACYEAVR